MTNEEFLKRQSLDDFNPVIEFVDYPVTVIDKILKLFEKHQFHKRWTYTAWDYSLKQFVTHTYAIRTTKTYGLQIMEVRRDFETYPTIYRNMYYTEWGCARGCHEVWNKKKATWNHEEVEPTKEWSILNDWYYAKMGRSFNEIQPLDYIIASDISLRYFGYVENNECTLLEYIRLYRKHPIVETFMKLGLYRFICNPKAIEFTTQNKAFRKWINSHIDEIKFMAFQTARNAWKKNPNGNALDYYNSLMYRIECGQAIASADKEVYNYTLKFATQEKIRDYLDDNNIGASSYFDYLKACMWLRLDFNDTKVLFPKDFRTYHDDYTRQYSEWKVENEKQKAIKEAASVSKGMLETADKFCYCNYTGTDYMIIIAKSKAELIDEGSKLSHCVGRMDYDKRQANGTSMICFLRKVAEPNVPYVTIELGLKDFKIKQCYAEHDTKPCEEVIDFAYNEWLINCNDRRKEQCRMN